MSTTVIKRKQETRLGDTITTVRHYERDESTGTMRVLEEHITLEGPPQILPPFSSFDSVKWS